MCVGLLTRVRYAYWSYVISIALPNQCVVSGASLITIGHGINCVSNNCHECCLPGQLSRLFFVSHGILRIRHFL